MSNNKTVTLDYNEYQELISEILELRKSEKKLQIRMPGMWMCIHNPTEVDEKLAKKIEDISHQLAQAKIDLTEVLFAKIPFSFKTRLVRELPAVINQINNPITN